MTLANPDGTFDCASCGYNVGGGGTDRCAIVNTVDEEQRGVPLGLRFCLDHDDENGDTVRGCVRKLLRPSMLKHLTATEESTRG